MIPLLFVLAFLPANASPAPALNILATRNVPDTLTIPLGGNCWASYEGNSQNSDAEEDSPPHPGGHLSNAGIIDWTNKAISFTAWFRTSQPGSIHLWLIVPSATTNQPISILVGGKAHKVEVPPSKTTERIDAGQWTLTDTGYHAVLLEGAGVAIESIVAAGPATAGHNALVPTNEDNFFYWGRRGPSVHLNYPLPDSLHAEWFYNEVMAPVGQDVQGSYFMAAGFGQGYFGMQVNSPTTRHILFSIWSPFQTDNPKAVPDSQKIVLSKKGPDVHTGEFGNEGSGGQSYLNYPWKAGTTYRFLVRAQPENQRHTVFTAWFYAPEEQHWRLIASWSRPATTSWLTRLHSFVENFDPSFGNLQRSARFGRQWVCDEKGRWTPLTQARFTGDNTARKGYRLDYGGGVRENVFYLRNGGFFSDNTALNQLFQRPMAPGATPPAIDFSSLP